MSAHNTACGCLVCVPVPVLAVRSVLRLFIVHCEMKERDCWEGVRAAVVFGSRCSSRKHLRASRSEEHTLAV